MTGGGPGGGVTAKPNTANCTADVANSTFSSTTCATAAPVQACPNLSTVCTLRAAVEAANANSGPTNTIVVPAGVYTLTIQDRNEDKAEKGDLDITNPVNITGAGASSVIIDGNGIDRVFDVFANGTTTISGVTIRNGNPGGICSTTVTQTCVANTGCPSGQTCVFKSGGGIQTGAMIP